MKRWITTMTAVLGVVAGVATTRAQGTDAASILRETRRALGGEDRLTAVRTLTATGRTMTTTPRGQVEEADFSVSLELPDKFMKRDVLMAMGPTSVYRNLGFNGGQLIDAVDAPPMLSGGGPGGAMIVRRLETNGPGGPPPTPEAQAQQRERRLGEARKEFARLTLGIFASSFAGYPLTFAYAGKADSPDGTADVLDVSAAGGFKARLFVDTTTRLPLMFSWMDLEPLMINVEDRGDGERVRVVRQGDAPSADAPNAESNGTGTVADQLRQAEAARRTVEYQTFYADYQAVDGVMVPRRISRSVDGRPFGEVVLDRVRINARIDAGTFTPSPSQ